MAKVGFFEEQPGQLSMTRLLVFMLICYAIVMSGAIGTVGLIKYMSFNPTKDLPNPSASLLDITIAIG